WSAPVAHCGPGRGPRASRLGAVLRAHVSSPCPRASCCVHVASRALSSRVVLLLRRPGRAALGAGPEKSCSNGLDTYRSHKVGMVGAMWSCGVSDPPFGASRVAARANTARSTGMKLWKSLLSLSLLALGAGCKGKGADETPAVGSVAAATAEAAPSKGKETGPMKVGILHSLSGTMAISETSLKDVALMTIDAINAKGGLLGRKLEPIVVDPASDWPLFAEKARELIQKEGVAVVFGCWTSVSRKSVLPVFEELNGLLFYPVQYEGEESSYNVLYTGAAPNQQAIPAVEYLMSEAGGGAKR